jgi:hypothetical protein
MSFMPECTDHAPIRIQVKPGLVTPGIDICDGYANTNLPPLPVVSILPTSDVSAAALTVVPTPTPNMDIWTPYTNSAYAISLQYPADW